MNPTRVFYDDIYLYEEVRQQIEGQAAPLVIKVGVGVKPEYQKLAPLLESLYEQAYKPGADGRINPDAVFPPKYYADHNLVITRAGVVWHLEYHSFPEPELCVYGEATSLPRPAELRTTSAMLYDQLFQVDGIDYLVTFLKGNYSDFPAYSPFVLNRAGKDCFVFSRAELAASGAVFTNTDHFWGESFDTVEWFRKSFAPLYVLDHFLPRN